MQRTIKKQTENIGQDPASPFYKYNSCVYVYAYTGKMHKTAYGKTSETRNKKIEKYEKICIGK